MPKPSVRDTKIERQRTKEFCEMCVGTKSVRQAAAEIGISYTAIGKIQSMQYGSSDRVVRKLADYIGWTFEEADHFIETGVRPDVTSNFNRLLKVIEHLDMQKVVDMLVQSSNTLQKRTSGKATDTHKKTKLSSIVYTDEIRDNIRKLYEIVTDGKTLNAVHQETGLSVTTIQKMKDTPKNNGVSDSTLRTLAQHLKWSFEEIENFVLTGSKTRTVSDFELVLGQVEKLDALALSKVLRASVDRLDSLNDFKFPKERLSSVQKSRVKS